MVYPLFFNRNNHNNIGFNYQSFITIVKFTFNRFLFHHFSINPEIYSKTISCSCLTNLIFEFQLPLYINSL